MKLTVDQIALVQHLAMRHLCRMDDFKDNGSQALFELQFAGRYSVEDFWRIACANVSLSQTLDKLLKQGESLAQHEQHAGNC